MKLPTRLILQLLTGSRALSRHFVIVVRVEYDYYRYVTVVKLPTVHSLRYSFSEVFEVACGVSILCLMDLHEE